MTYSSQELRMRNVNRKSLTWQPSMADLKAWSAWPISSESVSGYKRAVQLSVGHHKPIGHPPSDKPKTKQINQHVQIRK